MIHIHKTSQAEAIGEKTGVLLAPIVFFTIMYLVLSFFGKSLQYKIIVMSIIVVSLLVTFYINKKYKKWKA